MKYIILSLAYTTALPLALISCSKTSRLTLTRSGDTVDAEWRHMVSFAIPWRTEKLPGVTKIFGIPATMLAVLYVSGATVSLSQGFLGFPKKRKQSTESA